MSKKRITLTLKISVDEAANLVIMSQFVQQLPACRASIRVMLGAALAGQIGQQIHEQLNEPAPPLRLQFKVHKQGDEE